MIMLFLWLDFFSFLFFSFFFVVAPTAESDELDYLLIEGRDCVRGGQPPAQCLGDIGQVFGERFSSQPLPGAYRLVEWNCVALNAYSWPEPSGAHAWYGKQEVS
jgi:hypothetical protein